MRSGIRPLDSLRVIWHQPRALSIDTAESCITLAREASGVDMEFDPRVLEPVTKRQILFRMINNLRRAYLGRGASGKALQVLDLLLQADPQSAEEYRQRGLIHL